jgi:hypothetical protein
MTDEPKLKSRSRWKTLIFWGYQVFWIGYLLYLYLWPQLWPVLVSGGRRGVPELLTLVGPPLLALAGAVLAWGLLSALWLRLSDRDRVRMIWMACALPVAALSFMIGGPQARALLSTMGLGKPVGLAWELTMFALLVGFAYAFAYAGAELAGWRRNLTCLSVATAAWCILWTTIASGGPTGSGHDLGSILLIGGPVVIAWGVALALWRIDLDAERAAP